MSLHQQLLAATEPLMAGEHYSVARLAGPIAALRAVVELHPPYLAIDGAEYACSSCGIIAGWPCSTVETIARELGIEEDDRG